MLTFFKTKNIIKVDSSKRRKSEERRDGELSTVTKNVATYVREKGINLSKMARDTNIPYAALYSSLSDDGRERELRADELLGICNYLDKDPREFSEQEVV